MKIYDVTEMLDEEVAVVKIKGKDYPVNDGFKTVLKATSLFDDEKELEGAEAVNRMLQAIELVLGKEAAKVCETMKIGNVKTIFSAAMAAINGMSLEEMEARFQEQAE